MILKDLNKYIEKRKADLRNKLEGCGRPELAIVQVGSNATTNLKTNYLLKDANDVGIKTHWYTYEEEYTTEDLIDEIKDLAPHYDAVVVQLPLPGHIDTKKALAAIPKEKNVGKYAESRNIADYLEYCGFEPAGANIVIIGKTQIKLAEMMTEADATVTLCHSKTERLYQHLFGADLIITSIGKPRFLNCYPISVPIIDAGICVESDGHICGDCYNTINKNVVELKNNLTLLDNVVQFFTNKRQ